MLQIFTYLPRSEKKARGHFTNGFKLPLEFTYVYEMERNGRVLKHHPPKNISASAIPPINHHARPGDITTPLTRQPNHRIRNLPGQRQPPHRILLDIPIEQDAILGRQQRRIHEPRTHRIDPNPLFPIIQRVRLDEPHDAVFGNRVEPVLGHGHEAEDGAHLDDGAASRDPPRRRRGQRGLGFHDAQHGALAEPEAAQVHAEDAVEVGGLARGGGGEGGGDGGVVDEVVDAAEFLDGGGDGRRDFVFRGLVDDGGAGWRGGEGLQGAGCGDEARGGDVEADDAGAAVEGELENAGAADGAAGAGYEGDADRGVRMADGSGLEGGGKGGLTLVDPIPW